MSVMKYNELAKIIEACGKNGVTHFKMGDIEMTFNGVVIHSEKDYSSTVENIGQDVQIDPNIKRQEEYEIASDEHEHLLVTDPLAYEEMLLKGDMEESETHMDSVDEH